MNKEGKDAYLILKRNTLLSIYKCEFLLCGKLSESHGGLAHLVIFLMLLYGYL